MTAQMTTHFSSGMSCGLRGQSPCMRWQASQTDTKQSCDNLTWLKKSAEISTSTGRKREVERVNHLDVDLAVGVLKHRAVCAAPTRGITDSRAGPALVAQVARVACRVEAQLQGNCHNFPQLPQSPRTARIPGGLWDKMRASQNPRAWHQGAARTSLLSPGAPTSFPLISQADASQAACRAGHQYTKSLSPGCAFRVAGLVQLDGKSQMCCILLSSEWCPLQAPAGRGGWRGMPAGRRCSLRSAGCRCTSRSSCSWRTWRSGRRSGHTLQAQPCIIVVYIT